MYLTQRSSALWFFGFALLAGLSAGACGADDPVSDATGDGGNDAGTRVCTPGTSVACVGAGGCSGGQRCNESGTSFEACDCAAATADAAASGGLDGSVTDGASEASGPPTAGGVHATWNILQGASNVGCGSNPRVELIFTPVGGGDAIVATYACSAGAGDATDIPFGVYTIGADVGGESGAAGVSSDMQNVVLDGKACDRVVGQSCLVDRTFDIKLD